MNGRAKRNRKFVKTIKKGKGRKKRGWEVENGRVRSTCKFQNGKDGVRCRGKKLRGKELDGMWRRVSKIKVHSVE